MLNDILIEKHAQLPLKALHCSEMLLSLMAEAVGDSWARFWIVYLRYMAKAHAGVSEVQAPEGLLFEMVFLKNHLCILEPDTV